MLVTLTDYRRISKDNTASDADVTAAIEDATGILEAELGRPLTLAEYTETLDVIAGAVYPTVTPITAAPDGSQIVGHSFTTDVFSDTATVTYTGGYNSTTLPAILRRTIVEIASEAIIPASSEAQYASKRVGDTQVTYRTDVEIGSEKSLSTAKALFARRTI